jgi:hypothetical protein
VCVQAEELEPFGVRFFPGIAVRSGFMFVALAGHKIA